MRKIFIFTLLLVVLNCNAQSSQQLTDSLKMLKEQLVEFPDSLPLRFQKASLNLNLEQWEYAKNEYDYIIEQCPQSIMALFYRAYANEKLGRNAFARADYEAVIAADPDNFKARLGLIIVNQKDKRYIEAFDMVNHMVNQYPDSAIVYAIRAGIEKERKMLSLAEYDYSEAIKREPLNTDYILNRIDVRIMMGQKDKAKKDLDMLVKQGIPRSSLAGLYKSCR